MASTPQDDLPTIPPIAIPPIRPSPLTYAAPQVANPSPSEDLIPQAWTNVEILPLDPARLPRFVLWVILIQIGMNAAIDTVLILAMSLFHPDRSWPELIASVLCLLVFFMIYTLVTTLLAVNRTRRSWRVCTLILADEGLLLTQLKGPPKRVDRSEVVRIVDTFDTLRLHLPHGHANVSKRFLTPDHIRARLTAWQPIQQGKGTLGLTLALIYGFAGPLALVALFWFGMYTQNQTFLALCVFGTLALSTIQIVRLFRNRTTRTSTRIMALLCLLAPLLLAVRFFFPL